MAVIDPKVKNEQDENQAQPGAPSGSSGGVAPVGMPSAPKASSGRFTNVSSYLNANRDAGGKIANVVGQQLQKDVGQAQKQVEEGSNQFRSAVESEKTRLGQAQNFANQVSQDPTQIAQNQQQLQQFQQLYTPANISAQQQEQLNQQAQQTQQRLQQAQQGVQALGTEQGRMSALSRSLGRPSYTQGQQTLDQLLFQVGGANQLASQRQQAGQQVKGLTTQQNQFVDQMTQQLLANKQAEQEASNLLRGKVTGETSAFDEARIKEAQEKNTKNAQLNELYRQYILGNTQNLTDEQQADINNMLSAQGLSSGMKTYGALRGDEYQKFLQSGRTDLAKQDVVDAQELARIQALATLGGTQSAYAQAGNEGPGPGIKGAELTAAAQAARDKLMTDVNKLGRNFEIGTNTSIMNPNLLYMGGNATLGLKTSDLSELLKMYEEGRSGYAGEITDVGINMDNVDLNPGAISRRVGDLGNYANTEQQVNRLSGGLIFNQGQGLGYNNINDGMQRHIADSALSSLQAYLDNLYGKAGYFDTLGSNKQTGSIFTAPAKTDMNSNSGRGK